MGVSELIGIIGEGYVGTAQHALFPEAIVYDEPKLIERYGSDADKAIRSGRAAIRACGVSFICVPTPLGEDGRLDTSIVEEVVGWAESDVLVLRSTVNPGDTDRMKGETGKRIVVQPEYMGESPNHPLMNHKERPFMVLGGEPADRRRVIETYHSVYNANVKITQVTAKEAEVIKLSENRAIMYKVLQCQELYDACEADGIDYYTVRDAVYGDDPRMNLWWSFVYPDKRGVQSSCLPKDPTAWATWAETVGVKPEFTQAMIAYNERLTNAVNSDTL